MALVLYDTNILIDALKNYQEALEELAYWDGPAISVVTWMEIYAGAKPEEVQTIDMLIHGVGFEIIHTDDRIMRAAVGIRADSIRNKPKIALPDAIIMATAEVGNLTVITRNTKDFRGQNVRVPYELVTNADGSLSVTNMMPKILPVVGLVQPPHTGLTESEVKFIERPRRVIFRDPGKAKKFPDETS